MIAMPRGVVLLAVAILQLASSGSAVSHRVSSLDLSAMLDGLRGEVVGKYICSVAGGGDEEMCAALTSQLHNVTARSAISAQQMLALFAEPTTGPALYQQRIIEGLNAAQTLAADLSGLSNITDMLLEAADALEASFSSSKSDDADPGGATDVGIAPPLSPSAEGLLRDVPVNYDACGLHMPRDMDSSSYAGTERERKQVVSELRNANRVLCSRFKERMVKATRQAQGFLQYGSIRGHHLTYPASEWTTPLRYGPDGALSAIGVAPAFGINSSSQLGFDVRLQEWFETAVSLRKDVYLIVHCSASVRPELWQLMLFEMRTILSAFLSYQDYIGLDVGTSNSQAADKAECYSKALVKAMPSRKRDVDDILAGLQAGSARQAVQTRVQEACTALLLSRLQGRSSGGPQYLLFISDGVLSVEAADLTCAASAAALQLPFPVPDMHFIGFSLGEEADASLLQAAACQQAGMWWRIRGTSSQLSSFLDFVRDFTSFVLETSLQSEFNATLDAGQGIKAEDRVDGASTTSAAALAEARAAKRTVWLPTLTAGHNTPRPVLQVSTAVYRQGAGGLPRLDGVISTEMSMDWALEQLRAAVANLPVRAADAFVIYHRGVKGEVLAHSRGHLGSLQSTTADLNLSDEEQLAMEQHISSYEGDEFVTSGILQRMVDEPQGSATHTRNMWSEAALTFYQQTRLVTYFWTRIPRTALTAVVVISGEALGQNTSVVIHDELVDSIKCGEQDGNKLAAATVMPPLCWGGDGNLNFHRYDTIVGSEPTTVKGTVTSSFAVAPRGYNDPRVFSKTNWGANDGTVIAQVIQLQQLVNSAGRDAAKYDSALTGFGLRLHTLQELRMSAGVRAFWSQALTAGRMREAVWGLDFATETGILHTSPARLVDDSVDPVTLDWYMQAATHYGLTVALPPRLFNTSCASKSGCEGQQAVSGEWKSEWAVTLSVAVMHSEAGQRHPRLSVGARSLVGGGRLFGVVAVHVRLEHLVASIVAGTKLPGGNGCGDRERGRPEQQAQCYLVDHRARVIVHPALMAASAAGLPLDGLMEGWKAQVGDAQSDLSYYEPLMAERLIAAQVLSRRDGTVRNADFSFFEVNATVLRQYSDGSRKPQRQTSAGVDGKWPDVTGLPIAKNGQLTGAGIQFQLSGNAGDATVSFHEIAGTKLYLLVATDYKRRALPSLPFCGALSHLCPDVTYPLKNIGVRRSPKCSTGLMAASDLDESPGSTSLTDKAADADLSHASKTAAGFYKPVISEGKMRDLRGTYRHAVEGTQPGYTSEWLDCPRKTVPSWLAGPVSAAGLLLVVAMSFCSRYRKHVLKARQAAAALRGDHARTVGGEMDKEQEELAGENAGGGELRQVNLADDVDQGAGGVTAFRPLQQLQAQMTEDLWTRDSGSTALLESDLDALLHDVELISGQFDFMQQRVQAQDVISSSVQRLRRRSMHKLSELEQWQREMDQLIDAGQLHMLNQSLGHDLSQLSERHHGILPRGAREAAFYKHNYANKLHLGGADPLVEVERMVDAEEAGVNGREDRLRGLSQQRQDPKGVAWQAAGGRSLSSKSRSGTVLQASSASTEAFPSALPGAEQGNSIVWPKEVEAAASGQGKAGAREGDVML